MLLVGDNDIEAYGSYWSRAELQTPHTVADKGARVQRMFDGIAERYDLLNRCLSLGLDRRWRRQAVAMAQLQPGERVLDVCCGTGDVSFTAAKSQPALQSIIGIDFAPRMLDIAQKKQLRLMADSGVKLEWRQGDAEHLPFSANTFDAVFCGFGLRNLHHLDQGIGEIARVLRPDGRFVVLEFAWPKNRLGRRLGGIYLRCMAPLMGRCLSTRRHNAYAYLPASVATFDGRTKTQQAMRQAGLIPQTTMTFMFGMVIAMLGRKDNGQN